jgi:hypothetical protein
MTRKPTPMTRNARMLAWEVRNPLLGGAVGMGLPGQPTDDVSDE